MMPSVSLVVPLYASSFLRFVHAAYMTKNTVLLMWHVCLIPCVALG